MDTDSQTQRRSRRRRALACTQCRKRKLKCDHQRPCTSCQRSKDRICIYPEPLAAVRSQTVPDSHASPLPQCSTQPEPEQAVISRPPRPAAKSSEPGQSPSETRVWHSSSLGSVLVTKTPTPAWSGDTAVVAASPANVPDNARPEPAEKSPTIGSLTDLSAPPTMLMAKSRYLPPGHWLHSAMLSLPTLKWLDQEVSKQGDCWQGLQRCKALGESLKAQRLLLRIPGQYGSHLPDQTTSDQLFGNYLRTFETVYRIFHVPTLKLEYEGFLLNPNGSSSTFIIVFQLCLALGACIHDDTFSMRSYALQWIYEAQEWLDSSEKRRTTITGVQVMCLLLLAQQATESIYGDRVWILGGTLLRAAMCIGLHRDPARLPRMSIFQAEMRRRLWTVILELVLDSSIDSGQPALISQDDYDCELPSNVDDDQIGPDKDAPIVVKDQKSFTDASIQIALGRSIPLRLSISKHWSRIKPETEYTTVLHLSSQLRAARQSLISTLHAFHPKTSQFQHQLCDMVLIRYVFNLHMPYVAMSDPAFCHSHKTCVDAAMKLSYLTLPLSQLDEPLSEVMRATSGVAEQCTDFMRLALCGSGPFRTAQHIATSVIAVHLGSLVAEKDILETGSALRIAEELWLLRAGIRLTEQRIRAGQENVKDYVFFAVILSNIEATMKGNPVENAMAQRGREAIDHAADILMEMVKDQPTLQEMPASSIDEGDLDMVGAFWACEFPDVGWNDPMLAIEM
ncbi:C6 zinc finger domain-containing protein [Colletotrichum truncatum]|uniref:C6 zinc finger domain-containing protein n=1 Tax=Colletotrichum truncatum TaxID=5467 RepID=A0ACC3Z5F2_COLTU|nr:C6 zinc finger domain-containing protein [Colletotrichum truncatum]KAF6795081.1 C6 zinc finger domain-containing protein [Colletotrichum truncatum]